MAYDYKGVIYSSIIWPRSNIEQSAVSNWQEAPYQLYNFEDYQLHKK